MIKSVVVFLLVLCFSNTIAQNLSASVLDANTNEPLSFSTVSLFSSQNKFLKAETTNINGEFVFKNLTSGSYILKISFLGYKSFEQAFNLALVDLNLGTLKISPDQKMLKEVTVTAEKNQSNMGMDKRVFNMDKSITNTGGNAEGLLRTIPSISIDDSGNATLRNMATTIYIDGKPTQLSLAQIPASQIESVEVITNPSAKYDASTSGGIVNIVLKKNRETGFNGTVMGSLGQNNRRDASLNLNYHKNKWNLMAMYNLNATKNPVTGNVDRTNLTDGVASSYYKANTLINFNNSFQNARLAATFDANKFNTFTLATSAINGIFNSETYQTYQYLAANDSITSSGTRNTIPHNNFTNYGLEFGWKKTFAKKGKELNFNSQLNKNSVNNASNWVTTALNANNSPQANYPETDVISGYQKGTQVLGQLDYILPVNDSLKFEMGLRSYTYIRDQVYSFYNVNNESKLPIFNSAYSQNASITESVNAAYVMMDKKLKRNINFSVGLRFEQSFLHGLSHLSNTTFGYNYPSSSGKNIFQALFPSLAISKKFDENTEIGFSVSRKVGRPNWRQMSAGIQSNDRQNITIGNPGLQPEFVNTAEFSLTKNINKWSYFGSAYYIYEDHTIKPLVTPLATDSSILVTSFANVKADIQYGAENTIKYSANRLSWMASMNVFNFTLQSTDVNKSIWTYRSKINVSYKFKSNIFVQINASRDAKMPSLQGFRKPVQGLDFAIKKSFMQNRASFTFSVNDVFNSRRNYNILDLPSSYQTTMSRRDIRYYKFTLQLPIGKANNTFKKKETKLEKPDVDFGG